MKVMQKGFTLIELVVVIVILGILAATALPKFVDLTGEAATAAVAGVAGGVSSGAAINYAAKAAGKTVTPSALNGTPAVVCTTTQLGNLLTSGWPTGFTVAASATSAASCTSGTSVTCTITQTSQSKNADAVITCY